MENPAAIKSTQHCHITVALALFALCSNAPVHRGVPVHRTEPEIGGVGAPCCWCREYLNIATDRLGVRCNTRACEGAQPDGWMMPAAGPEGMAEGMADSVAGYSDAVVYNIQTWVRNGGTAFRMDWD
jgi:hypothetical protein